MTRTPSRQPDPRLSNLVLEGGRSKVYPSISGSAAMDSVSILSVAKLEGTHMSEERARTTVHAVVDDHDGYRKRLGLAALLVGAAALLFSIALTCYLLWLMVAPVRATAFDSDGVRCYSRAVQIACIQTANP